MRLTKLHSCGLFSSVLSLLPALVAAYSTISDATLKSLPDPSSDFDIENGKLLAPILIPRVPGTPNSLKVLQHFTDFWTHELPDWKIEYDNSTSKTPFSDGKQVPFRNFMAIRDPPWSQPGEVGRLVLVAHYDSKIYPQGFVGATDSAAPCAMLMHAASAIDKALTKKWKYMEEERKKNPVDRDEGLDDDPKGGDVWNRGVMVLLMDGEEAFDQWTDEDSLYGSRNLAQTLEKSFHVAGSRRRTALASIDLFLLLDLLGAKDPHVPSFFKTTHWAYKAMSDLEHRMRELGVFKTGKRPADRSKNFLNQPYKKASEFSLRDGVQDDHIPFLRKGVEILHIIPLPFPRVWHELEDNGQNLHMDTVHDWAMLTTAFAAEWMELEGYFDTKAHDRRDVRTEL